MTDISSQSDDREKKFLVQESINQPGVLPTIDSVQFSSSKETSFNFNVSKVKVEVPDSRRFRSEMDERGFPDKHADNDINRLKITSDLPDHQTDATVEQSSMYCLSDVNILVPMFCHDIAEHGLKHQENPMTVSKNYIIQSPDVTQQQIMTHFQQQQQQQEFLPQWHNNSSPSLIGSSYDSFNSDYIDYQSAMQPQPFQHQQLQEMTTNPPKKKRRRIITTDQRRAANIRERRRMSHLNEAFDGLRKRVPTFAYEKKLSRIETLKLAVTYIKFMSNLLETLDASGDKSLSGEFKCFELVKPRVWLLLSITSIVFHAGAGFHSDQKLLHSSLSNSFHPSLSHVQSHQHQLVMQNRYSDKNLFTSPNSLVTDEDESLDDDESSDVISLPGNQCVEISSYKELDLKK